MRIIPRGIPIKSYGDNKLKRKGLFDVRRKLKDSKEQLPKSSSYDSEYEKGKIEQIRNYINKAIKISNELMEKWGERKSQQNRYMF